MEKNMQTNMPKSYHLLSWDQNKNIIYGTSEPNFNLTRNEPILKLELGTVWNGILVKSFSHPRLKNVLTYIS